MTDSLTIRQRPLIFETALCVQRRIRGALNRPLQFPSVQDEADAKHPLFAEADRLPAEAIVAAIEVAVSETFTRNSFARNGLNPIDQEMGIIQSMKRASDGGFVSKPAKTVQWYAARGLTAKT